MDFGEVLLAIISFTAVVTTFLLRKDLEKHHLQVWVYTTNPLMLITSLTIVLWDEIPEDLRIPMLYSMGSITMVTLLIGAIIAYRRA